MNLTFVVNNKEIEKRISLLRDEKEIGYCTYYLAGDEVQITHIEVVEGERRKGFGKELITTIIKKYSSKYSKCVLEVSERNSAAVNLYRECGFKEVGRRRKYYRDGSDAVLMEQFIANSKY
ncbi:GNAT family N-acetyltransferase [Candidatus Margulisiibacteriota bacterium]